MFKIKILGYDGGNEVKGIPDITCDTPKEDAIELLEMMRSAMPNYKVVITDDSGNEIEPGSAA